MIPLEGSKQLTRARLFQIATIVAGLAAIVTIVSSGLDGAIFMYKIAGFLIFYFTLKEGLLIDKDLFSPYTLFALAPFCTLIYDDFLSPSYLPLPDGLAVTCIIIGQASFLLGLKMSGVVRSVIWRNKKGQKHQNRLASKDNYRLLFIVGIVPFLLSLSLRTMNIQFSAEGIDEFRSNFTLPIISAALSCFTTAGLLGTARERRYFVFFSLIVTMVVVGLFTQAKGSAVLIFLTIIFASKKYWRLKSTSRIVFVSLILMFAMFQVYGMIRQGYFHSRVYVSSYEYYRQHKDIADIPRYLQIFYKPYMYMETPLSNFAYLVENNFTPENGKLTAWPFISIFQLKRFYTIEKPVKPIRKWPYNTHTFLGDFYLDFGVMGILILPFLLGLIVSAMYSRTLVNRDIIMDAVYLYFSYATFMMFFSNHFTSSAYPLRIFLVFEFYRLIIRPIRIR
ncbi:hypothetical protein Dalk_1329 [Desulfatibacillum aliphaticivorans]|uniref:Oligosaccharide repeat unit polymerase n=1 Tax=Desulfatibacillum aliphaticivorans TaxID=218208 RepID=B8F9T4_DESAL|nr:O-antigen polymerase [Desulfatibacillum aliphaticivorans]ACL03030.1 hypothetical protein Dalk_1329 [Desulfatibacillum aliphaticivorans]